MPADPKYVCVANREVALADVIPYSTHVTDYVIKTREGDYLRIWKLAGIAFEAADPVDILVRHDGFNQLVRGLPGGHTALWSHRLRRHVSDHFATPYGNRFCQELATRYYASFAGYRMMANELYLTLVYRPNRTRLGRVFRRAARRTRDDIRRAQQEALKVVDELAAQVESSLKPYDPVALGVYRKPSPYTKRPRRYSSALELLGYLVNGVWEPEPVPSGPIREALPTSRLFVGVEKVEIRMPAATRHAALLDLKDYPEETEPGMLNGLLYGDFEYIETQSFTILDKPDAKEALERQRNQLIAGEDVAVSQVDAMDQALNDLINGDFVLGEYHYSLAVLGDTPEKASKAVAKARTQLADAGFQTALIDLVADAAWFAQLPGNWRYRPREAKLTSRNFCGLSSLHNFATGKRQSMGRGDHDRQDAKRPAVVPQCPRDTGEAGFGRREGTGQHPDHWPGRCRQDGARVVPARDGDEVRSHRCVVRQGPWYGDRYPGDGRNLYSISSRRADGTESVPDDARRIRARLLGAARAQARRYGYAAVREGRARHFARCAGSCPNGQVAAAALDGTAIVAERGGKQPACAAC
jgi:type IV secretion system protein VirB4